MQNEQREGDRESVSDREATGRSCFGPKSILQILWRALTHTPTQPRDTNTDAAAARNRKAARASNVSILNKYFQLNITIRSSRG